MRRALLLTVILALGAAGVAMAESGGKVLRFGQTDATEFVAGSQVTLDEAVEGDLHVAGGRVRLDTQVTGDVVAAASMAVINGAVGGRLDAAGIVVRSAATVGQRLNAAGAFVTLDARVAGRATASGLRVRLGRAAEVRDDFLASGALVEVLGKVGKTASLAGGHVLLDGVVDGDVEVQARSLQIGPNARLGGNVIYRGSGKALRDPAAVVAGNVVIADGGEMEPEAGHGLLLSLLAGMFLFGIILDMAFPAFVAGAVAGLQARALRCGALGAGVLVVATLLAAILLASVIGIPLGLALGALATLLALGGFVITLMAMADFAARRWWTEARETRAKRWLTYALLLALAAVPWVVDLAGPLSALLAVIFGAGAAVSRVLGAWPAAPATEAVSA